MVHPLQKRPRLHALILDRQHRCLLLRQLARALKTSGDWRDGYIDCFTQEAAALGLPFDDSSSVFNESFHLVKVLGPATEGLSCSDYLLGTSSQ